MRMLPVVFKGREPTVLQSVIRRRYRIQSCGDMLRSMCFVELCMRSTDHEYNARGTPSKCEIAGGSVFIAAQVH